MLTRPLTLNDGNDRGRGLVAVTPHPALPLADEGNGDNETDTGVFPPPVPPRSFCSSASSPPSLTLPHSFLSSPSLTFPGLPFSSTSFSTTVSLLSPPPSSLCPAPPDAPSPLSSSSSTCPTPLPVFFTSCTPPTSSLFAPLSSSHPVLPSLHSSPSSLLSSACTPPPNLAPPLISAPLSRHDSPSLSPAPSLLYHCSSLISPPPPLPPHTSAFYSASSSSSPIPPSLSSLPPTSSSPSLLPPAPLHCCPCSSLLPRLLSAHRLEVRRLLRGALVSLGHRLDSLERKIRRKKRKKRSGQRGEGRGSACSPGLAEFPLNPTSSFSPAQLPPVITHSSSSSSDAEDSPTPPLSSSLSQSEHRSKSGEEERERHGRKRRRKNHRGREMIENRDEEEEAVGRFMGRMAASAEEEEAPLTLQNFNHKQERRREGGGSSQSEKAASVVRWNGFRGPLLLHSSSPQNALHLLQSAQTCSQSEVLGISSGQWHFTDFTAPFTLSSNHRAFHLWLCNSSSSSFSCSPMLRFSAVAMETISESVRGGTCGSPLRPLKDRTAPPSLGSDHCYVRTPTPSPANLARRQQMQRANHSSHCLHLPRRRSPPLPLYSANGLSALLPTGQSAAGSKFLSTNEERGKRVSQIRIRRASPREMSLTPMGLPKVKRLKKKEFSLEEIYTNKNYKSPSNNRSLETIFEEPREKDGALLLIGQQRRRRLILFPDFTQPRKRKRPQGVGLTVAMVPRKRTAVRRHCHGGSPNDESDLDVMLVERLSALEDFLTRQGLDV